MAAHGTRSGPVVKDLDDGTRFSGTLRCARLERLDQDTLDLLAGDVETVCITLESHLAELAERVRTSHEARSAGERVRSAVELCRERGLGLEVEVPFAVENAVVLPRTVAWLADAGVAIIRVVPHPPRMRAGVEVDPFACFSDSYVERTRSLIEDAAREAGVGLVWEPREGRTFGLTALPQLCEEPWGRLHVRVDGSVSACALAPAGDLELGRLEHRPLEEIWRGDAVQDLRRAHLTGDYPRACAGCPRTRGPAPEQTLPFIRRFVREFTGGARIGATVEVRSPGRLSRWRRPPLVTVAAPGRGIEHWYLVFARGGEDERCAMLLLDPEVDQTGLVTLRMPERVWAGLEPNTAYWWTVFGSSGSAAWVGTAAARCLVRHEPIPRLPGSPLVYPGEAAGPLPDPRLVPGLSREHYDALVMRIAGVVPAVVPPGSVAAIVSKGDDRLLALGPVEARHFPCADDGEFIGYHPPDGAWAVEHLERARAAGVAYLVVPATALWWYDRYPEFAAYVGRCELLLEDRETCIITAVGKENGRA
jgi:hypothetical protein